MTLVSQHTSTPASRARIALVGGMLPPVRIALAAGFLAAALVAALLAGASGDAGAAAAKLIGKTKQTPSPDCPKTPCEAIGSVTGFQTKADGKNGIFKVRQKGHVVGWSVDVSRPNAEQREFFGDFYRDREFGTDPVARIGILRHVGGGRSGERARARRAGDKFRLIKQSPPVKLGSELGGTPVITLNDPLRVNKGDVVALTIPSWLSNFATEQSRDDVWRASRSPQKCTGRNEIQQSRPHEKVGDTRRYGCRYTTARLLYWAYFVPESRGGGGGGDGSGDGGGGGGSGGGGGP
jgi:hypothetical protein